MNVSDMITEIQEHGFEDISSTRIVAAINDAYHDVVSRYSWPWAEVTQTASSVVGNQTLTLATAIRKVQKVVDTTNDIRLYYSTMEDLVNQVSNVADVTDTSIPTNFYLYDGVLNLYPTPNAVNVYRVWGVATTADLTSGSLSADILIPPRHHRVLILGALANLAPLNDDLGLSQFHSGRYEQRIQHMVTDSFDISSDRELVMVDTYSNV